MDIFVVAVDEIVERGVPALRPRNTGHLLDILDLILREFDFLQVLNHLLITLRHGEVGHLVLFSLGLRSLLDGMSELVSVVHLALVLHHDSCWNVLRSFLLTVLLVLLWSRCRHWRVVELPLLVLVLLHLL